MAKRRKKKGARVGRDSKGRIKKGYRLTRTGVRKVTKKKRRRARR